MCVHVHVHCCTGGLADKGTQLFTGRESQTQDKNSQSEVEEEEEYTYMHVYLLHNLHVHELVYMIHVYVSC